MWTEFGYLAVGLLGGAAVTFSICQERLRRKLEEADLLFEKKYDEIEMKARTAALERDDALHKLKSWMPSPLDIEEAWAEAERMANHRKMLQAGRIAVPRSDAGPPAKVSRAVIRGGPRRPLGGI